MIDSLATLLTTGAQRTPQSPVVVAALADGTIETVTYAQAEAATAALAVELVAGGVQPGDRVVIAKHKSIDSFLAVHAAIRAAAIAVPVDPLAPGAALQPLVADADPAVVIGDEDVVAKLTGVRAFLAPLRTPASVAEPDRSLLPEPSTGDAPAYMIYSSGSTGVPKGILHSHRSGLAYAAMAAAEYGLTAADRLAAMTPLHFDMSTLELYAMPLVGGSSAIFSEAELKFPATFAERASVAGCTIWYGVPYLIQQVVERGALDRHDYSPLHTIAYGGEVYPIEGIRRLLHALPGVRITNVYGPAEVNAITHFHLDSPPTEAIDTEVINDVPLGELTMGTEAMIVGPDRTTPVALGEVGELVVSAPTRMLGYWNRPDLDEATTIARPDGPDWYRTGDLVVASAVVEGIPSGLQFRGRRDHQVKVRGVRLELEGIEAVLSAAPGVLHAVVGPNEASDELLAAVVMRDDADFDERSIRRWLATRVSAAALPSRITERASMATTSSGKIDRRTVRQELVTPTLLSPGAVGGTGGEELHDGARQQ